MKTFVVFAALIACAMAGLLPHYPQNSQPAVLVKETPSDNIGLDGYRFAYELSDGQKREESAQVQPARSANEEATLRVSGSYSWVNPEDGQTYTVTYVADENGFQPQGAHIPVV